MPRPKRKVGRPPKKEQLKQGRFTKDELEFIYRNMGTMSSEAIATALNRRKQKVEEAIARETDNIRQPAEVVAATKKSKAWDMLEAELTADEIKIFGEEYSRLVSQFHENITPSEEMQLMDVVKFQILISRVLAMQQSTIKRINKLQETLREIEKRNDLSTNEEMARQYKELHAELNFADKSLTVKTKDLVDLQKQKESILESLKITRNQRIKNLQEAGKFLGLLEELRQIKNQEEESRHFELIKRAAARTKEELQSPHKYVTGEVDCPLLTPEGVESAANE